MVHIIVQDIIALREKAFSEASPKEKLFYLWLTDGHTKSIQLSDSDLDTIALEAFSVGSKSSDTLKKLQRSKPLKNLHYSKNLLDLIAAATIDFEGERKHIEEYLQEHGLREAYILHNALGVEIPSNIQVSTDIELLINHIFVNKSAEFSVELFKKALFSVNHIFDVLILERIYAEILKVHPEAVGIEEFKKLRSVAKKISSILNGIIMFFLTVFVVYGAVRYLNWYVVNKDFNDWILEIVLQVFGTLLIVCFFLGLNIPEKVKLLNLLRNKILTVIYWSFGLKYAEVQKILSSDDK